MHDYHISHTSNDVRFSVFNAVLVCQSCGLLSCRFLTGTIDIRERFELKINTDTLETWRENKMFGKHIYALMDRP